MSKLLAEVELEIPFHDVDSLRIVWHGHYLKYFEIARTRLFKNAGLDAEDFLRRGIWLVVVESRCRHMRSLGIGDRIVVEARFLPNQPRPTVVYRVRNLTRGEISARGRTVLAVIRGEDGAMVDLPSDMAERMDA
jgi:acyl-CoA thioester hydrolase